MATQPRVATPSTDDVLAPKLSRLFFKPGSDGRPVYIPSRYKIAYGGRGSSKSWGFTGVAAMLASGKPLRVLCVRELQNSIQESVHKLLSDRIESMHLGPYFDIQRQGIYGRHVNSEFIFAGIKNDPGKIKSTEGIDICFVEEAEKVSETSWKVLIPTIRKTGSELWIVFNPNDEKDPTYQRFVKHMPPQCRRVEINWYDNPWFPKELELERQYALQLIADAADDDERAQLQADYDHVWEGKTMRRSDAAVFRRRVVVEPFEDPPYGARFHFGADFGFANDPTALVRFWITDHVDANGMDYQELWISHEAFGYRVEIDETPTLFDTIPGARLWPMKGDCSRPETISYLSRHGFNISEAEKWQGSVEDGIAHIKAFRKIHIHPRCKHLQEEARLYSYKIDRLTGQVLPVIVDAHNHGWDAIRYGLDGYIQRRGIDQIWAKLAQ